MACLGAGDERAVHDQNLFERIALALEAEGFVVLSEGLPEAVADTLLQHLDLYEEHEFALAAVGRGPDAEQNKLVRRDKIAWIDPSSPNSATWLNWTRALQTYLNRRLFMGLFSFESHFAFYRPGDFYATHLDAFRGQSNRVLSLVTYLNKNWKQEQGGELVIFEPNSGAEIARVSPCYRTLVLFLSEEFPHEVRPATRTRHSVAGWFRINTSTTDRVDPPL